MRRIVMAITVLLCLAFGAEAYAAVVAPSSTDNGYSAQWSVGGGRAKNIGVTYTESLGTTPPTNWGRPYPLADIATSLSGVSSPYAKYFPKCTVAQINAAGNSGQWNGVCPKGSLVAHGTLVATIGDSTASDPTLTNAPLVPRCDLDVWVYNAGPGNLAYFFTVPSGQCGPLATGAALPFPGTYKVRHGALDQNIPEDANVSFNAGGTGDWGSLLTETLKWGGSVQHHGKSYPYLVSAGCAKTKKRTWSATFTSTDATGSASTNPLTVPPAANNVGTVTVKGSSKCG